MLYFNSTNGFSIISLQNTLSIYHSIRLKYIDQIGAVRDIFSELITLYLESK